MKTYEMLIDEFRKERTDKVLYELFMENHKKSKRAFYLIEKSLKKKGRREYGTGLKIEKTGKKYDSYIHRQDLTDCTYINIKGV